MVEQDGYWEPPRNYDDYDLNKVSGLTFGLFGIHKNSARLTSVPDFDTKNVLDIYGYTYDSSVNEHTAKILCSVTCGIEQVAILELHKDFYYFLLNGNVLKMKNKTPDPKLQKENYPFHGGNNTAPNTYRVWTKVEVIK